MTQDPGPARVDDALLAAAERMASGLAGGAEHERTVAHLSDDLFDALEPLHGLGDEYRRLLEVGAMLHDTGWEFGGRGHHKASERLILDSDLPFGEERGRAFAAAVARYHRKALPDPVHETYARLHPGDREPLRWCAACVRIADGLDRGHDGSVRRVSVTIDSALLTITASCAGDRALALWGAERKVDLLEEIADRKVRVVADGAPA